MDSVAPASPPDPGIRATDSDVGATESVAPTKNGPKKNSIGAIIGQFKSVTTKQINKLQQTPGASRWQRNYYERIIRNKRELDNVRQYIMDNPLKWETDENNPYKLSG